MGFLIVGIILAVVVCKVQLALFFYFNRKIIHFIPLMVIGALYIVALGLFIYDLNFAYGFAFGALIAFIIAGLNTVALIGDGVAWLIEKV